MAAAPRHAAYATLNRLIRVRSSRPRASHDAGARPQGVADQRSLACRRKAASTGEPFVPHFRHSFALPLLLLVALSASPGVRADDETRSLMNQVFDAIAYLLPLSVRENDARSDWDRELVDEKLTVLRRSADALADHTRSRTPEFGLLARSFDETVADIDQSFRQEWPSYAYFSLMELTQHCVACHAQHANSANAAFSQRLLARINTDVFDDTELAQLYVATRQFEAAERALARKLLDPADDAIDLDIAGVTLDYLQLCIGVTQEPAKANALLERFAARSDVPLYLRERVAHWRSRLDALAPDLSAAPSLDSARTVYAAASREFRGTRDRGPAVDDLVAATLLRRFIDAQPTARGPAVAEAYHMLGVIALRTLEPKYSVPEMEILFTSAIEADPHGPWAHPSFLLLEEFGFIRDVPLARVSAEADQKLIDMDELLRLSAPRPAP